MDHSSLRIVFVGAVDHGKSSLIGRLLMDSNSLAKERINELKNISRQFGEKNALAFLTDQLKEERENQQTIETTEAFLKIQGRHYVFIDTPGHLEFLKNMMTGTTHADAAVLVVDVREGIQEQTRRHLYLLKILGLTRIIAAVNKMDLTGYQKDAFDNLCGRLSKATLTVGLNIEFFIPLSAAKAVNTFKKSKETPWYKGPCLFEAVKRMAAGPKKNQSAFRFPVQDVYKVNGEHIFVGRIASGEVKVKDEVVVFPSCRRVQVDSIKVFDQTRKTAAAQESIGLVFTPPLEAHRGCVVCGQKTLPRTTEKLKANLFWFSHQPLGLDKKVTLRCATQTATATIESIEERFNPATLEIIEDDAQILRANESAVVTFKLSQPLIFEQFIHAEDLGRFLIEDEQVISGAGILTEEFHAKN